VAETSVFRGNNGDCASLKGRRDSPKGGDSQQGGLISLMLGGGGPFQNPNGRESPRAASLALQSARVFRCTELESRSRDVTAAATA
jgi:hypothetical protein